MKDISQPELKGIGPYSPGKPICEVKRELKLESVVKLASNECPLPPFPQVQEAIKGALGELNRYPDGSCFELRGKLAGRLRVGSENVLIGAGSNELIRLIAQAVLGEGDKAVMAKPSFVVYPTVVKMRRADACEVPLTQDYRHDLPAMNGMIDKRTRLVFIANPNNPTGTIVYREELDAFLDGLPDDVLVVIDEAYYEYVEDERFLSGFARFRPDGNVVVLRTFSKIYGLAGLRVGYGAAPAWVVQAVEKIREPFNVNSLAQVAAERSLDFPEEVRRRARLNSDEKRRLYGEFDRLGLAYVPTEGNFILVDVRIDSGECMDAFLRKGVIARSGGAFGYPRHLRVTVGLPEENARLVVALEEVQESTR